MEVWHWRRCLRRKTGSLKPPFFTLPNSTFHQTSEYHPPTPRSFFTSRTRSGALLTMNTMTTITRANVAEDSHAHIFFFGIHKNRRRAKWLSTVCVVECSGGGDIHQLTRFAVLVPLDTNSDPPSQNWSQGSNVVIQQ